ncbi:TPA: hypothetical protein ACNLHT_004025 [Escherichia coli]
MPQLALAPASLRRPGFPWTGRCTARVSASEFTPSRVSLDGALYCACERQRATGATLLSTQIIIVYQYTL